MCMCACVLVCAGEKGAPPSLPSPPLLPSLTLHASTPPTHTQSVRLRPRKKKGNTHASPPLPPLLSSAVVLLLLLLLLLSLSPLPLLLPLLLPLSPALVSSAPAGEASGAAAVSVCRSTGAHSSSAPLSTCTRGVSE